MVEDHRRVEPRQIAGSGMATDPERIQRIADDAARHARAWRPPAEVGFGDVLGKAPPRGELADEPPPRERPPAATDAAPTTTTAAATTAPASTTAPTTTPAAPARLLRTTPRAPDPRQRALLQRLEQALPTTTKAAPAPAPAAPTETPPTGTAAPTRKPR